MDNHQVWRKTTIETLSVTTIRVRGSIGEAHETQEEGKEKTPDYGKDETAIMEDTMNKIKHYISASLGLILFVSVVALSIPQTGHSSATAAAPPDKDVRVINTETEAVPVRGTVRARQQGDWTVGIVGTPTVEVGNTEAAPVLTRDVDRPTAQPFKAEVVLNVPDGNGGENAFVTIPAGKILVIEHVSAWGSVPPSEQMEQFSILARTLPDLTLRPHYLQDSKRDFPTVSVHTISETVRIYAEGTVGVRAGRRTSTGSVTFRYTISGHLVDK